MVWAGPGRFALAAVPSLRGRCWPVSGPVPPLPRLALLNLNENLTNDTLSIRHFRHPHIFHSYIYIHFEISRLG